MSQQEFDNYLALLTRLLRIAPQQREQMAEEFRTHMEDRLDDLLARGTRRDEAVQMALEEFGDAASLAAQLASISWNRKKRWYMKVSAFSVAGLAAVMLLAIALWPESQRLPGTSQAVAQQPAGKTKHKGRTKAPLRRDTLEHKLATRIAADFIETPMSDVLSFVGDSAGIQFYINRRALSEENVDLDTPITMSLNDVQVETVLDLALEQVSEQLAYLERDGVLIISTVTALEGATEVRVYNCRDLLALTISQPGMAGMEGMMGDGMMGMPGGMMSEGMMPGMGMPVMPGMGRGMRRGGAPGGSGFPPSSDGQPEAAPNDSSEGGGAAPAEIPRGTIPGESGEGAAPPPLNTRTSIETAADRAILAQRTRGSAGGMEMGAMPGGGGGMPGGMGGMMPGMGGGGMGGMSSRPAPTTDHERRAARLMDLITTAVDPASWQNTGGFGTISEYEGMIVVSHNPRTHKKIDNVLTMLRQSAGLPQMPQMSRMGGMGDMGGGMGAMMEGGAFGGRSSSAGGAAADPFGAGDALGGDPFGPGEGAEAVPAAEPSSP